MKVIRIPFADLELTDLSASAGSAPDPGDTPEPEIPFLPAPEFSLAEVPLPGRGHAFPEGTVDFEVPAADMPRVSAWFTGNYQGVTTPASSTLNKNMKNAVLGLLEDFFREVSSLSLFAAPFRIKWRWRLKNGSVYAPDEPLMIVPASVAPLIVIEDYGLSDKYLTTSVIIRRMPSRLDVSIPHPGDMLGQVSGIEFFATSPVALYAKDCAVNGIRSADIDGARARIWHYDANSESKNLSAAEADDKFKFIGAIDAGAFSAIAPGSRLIIPVPFDALPLPDHSVNPDVSGSDDDPEIFRPDIYVETPPLDLGDPEAFKRIRALYLRGIFPRRASGTQTSVVTVAAHSDSVAAQPISNMELSLFGSIHRENWRLLARAPGPFIRGLRGISCRWFKVRLRITLRPGDRLDALTFTTS